MDEDGSWVFNRLAEDYRARPGYPPGLVDRLAEVSGGRGTVVADLGAGTGLLALPLADRGLRVVAVEPSRAMLAILREEAARRAVEAVQAPAERTGLPRSSAGAAVVADALQWIEPALGGLEVARVVADGGVVAVVAARLCGHGFAAAVSALVAEANPKARPRPAARLGQFFRAAGVARWEEETFRQEEPLSPPRLDAVLRSLSLVGPALGPDRLARLLAEARGLAEVHGGAVWARDLTLSFGRRSGF